MIKLLQFVFLIMLIAFIGWVGVTIWSCTQAGQAYTPQDLPNMPDHEEAAYALHIKNTGGLILTSDYELQGTDPGSRIYILDSFWELRGQKFVYKDTSLILDESIFGEITLKRR